MTRILKSTKNKQTSKQFSRVSGTRQRRPYLTQIKATILVVCLIFAIQVIYNYVTVGRIQPVGYAASVSPGDVIAGINNNRAANGLRPLTFNGQLSSSANAKARDMIAHNYWGHVSPSGLGIAHFIANAGYNYRSFAENLAKDFTNGSSIVSAWMLSSSHRENILGDYTEVGVGVVPGRLLGAQTIVVVAHFGKPLGAPAAPQAPTQPKPKPKPKAPVTTTPRAQQAPARSNTTTQAQQKTTKKSEKKKADKVKKAPKKENKKKLIKEDSTEKSEDRDADVTVTAVGSINGVVDTSNPLGIFERAWIAISHQWAASLSLLLLAGLLVFGAINHYADWRYQAQERKIVSRWPVHMRHGAHTVALFVGAGLIVTNVVGTIL